MKTNFEPMLLRILAVFLAALCADAGAALTDINNTPLASSASGSVKPNINFVLDSSGSMAWSHAPDEVVTLTSLTTKVGYKTSQCNSIYYRPDILYVPPKHADGTDFPKANFFAAWKDGFDTTAGTVDLSASFYAYDNISSFLKGTDTLQPAYYYVYKGDLVDKGGEPLTNFQNTNSQFFQECSTPDAGGPAATISVSGNNDTVVTSIKVNGVELMSGASAKSNKSSTVASSVATRITLNGYTATSSGSTITIVGPASAVNLTPVVTSTQGGMSFTPGKFSPFVKVLVGATSGPGGTDERQNFANWFSYYRTRILMMKSGAGRAFATIGPTYRVGFMTIYADPGAGTGPQYLPINDFDATQKASWYSKFYAMDAAGATPLKAALSTAGRNFAGKLGPDPVQYSCQQNFLILTTDGYWNDGSANPVNVNGGALSPASQDSNPAKTPRPMYDGGLAGASNTLADGAAYYYNTDLRNSAFGNCTGALGAGTDVCLDNVPTAKPDSSILPVFQDTAPWQHMTTFTLGLGTNGQLGYTADYLTKDSTSTDFNAIVAGSKDWPVPVGDKLTTIDDLWHAAVNGHGQYFSAKNPNLLVSGLRDALSSVSTREAAGTAAATSNLEPVAGDNFVFIANYRTVKWDGDVQARSIDLVTGQITNNTLWSAQAQLDAQAPGTRKIFTFLNGNQADFVPSSFNTTQKAQFDPNANVTLSQRAGWTPGQITAATADSLINYLRGDTTEEERGTTDKLYRSRDHILGDIIDGKPVYVKVPPFNYVENNYQAFRTAVSTRQAALYVPANDGMLHAFNANTGDELFAYIPSFVLPKLKLLADDAYPNLHEFLTDASPTVSDIWTGSSWKTLLVAGLNAGGKGYYALDVTNPAAPAVMWEFTDANMGFTYGNPVVGKLADGTWVVAVTSGYNNADGVGRLYILNAATGTLIFSISTGVGTPITPSGLGRISGWVDDSLNDNTLQRIYGGDLLGNVWRFDVNDILPPAGRDVVKLATLAIGTTAQPITTKPELGLFNNKPIVYVGTGRYLGTTDLNDTSQQSVYAIRDDLAATGVGNPRTSSCQFVQQTLSIIDANTRTTSRNPVDFSRQCGWFMDFNPANATPGERVNVDPQLQLGVLAVATNIPEKSVCTVGGSSFIYFLDYGTGGFVSTALNGVAGTKIGNSITVGLSITRVGSCADCGTGGPGNPTTPVAPGRVVVTATTAAGDYVPLSPPDNPSSGPVGKRVMWRELLN